MTLKFENHIPGQILTLQLSLFSSKALDLGGPTSQVVSTLLSFCVNSTVILLLPPDSHLAFTPLLEYLHLTMRSITQIQKKKDVLFTSVAFLECSHFCACVAPFKFQVCCR